VSAELRPDDRVRIILGLLDGKTARVVRRASWDWANSIPLYELAIDGVLGVRTIRSDFLRRVP
jgi:hypothetical protein